jgi:hypothetical protein
LAVIGESKTAAPCVKEAVHSVLQAGIDRDVVGTDSHPGPSSLWVMQERRQVELAGWDGPWEPTDPDANFKADVALYAGAEPMRTISSLADAMQMPEGAIVHYVLAKWASEGSAGLLEVGPTMVRRLSEPIERAEQEGTDEARLHAYDQLRQMVSWLRLPLDDPEHAGY